MGWFIPIAAAAYAINKLVEHNEQSKQKKAQERYQKAPVCGDCGMDRGDGAKYCVQCGGNEIVTRSLYEKAPTKQAREALKKREEAEIAALAEKERQQKILDKENERLKKEEEKKQAMQDFRRDLQGSCYCPKCRQTTAGQTKYCGQCGGRVRGLMVEEVEEMGARKFG